MGLHEPVSELMGEEREDVPWAEVAAVLTAGKFCGQASELGVAEEWYARTALEDISGIAPELINDDRLYRGVDHLRRHKDRLCEHLMQRYRDWFGVRFEFLLYDVTSTYFEGQALGNTKAARGYSRDKRSDCKQVCIGLVCTPEGVPLNYEVFDRELKAVMVRYADDFVVLCRKGQGAEVYRRLKLWLERRKLKLNEEKTRVVNFEEDGLEFLGFQLSWRKGSSGRKYPHCEPSAKSAHKLRETVREETARDTLWMQPEEIIQRINQRMRGWAGYFHYGNST